MLEYIYFVKCPGCEDEHFHFFDEAKGFAMGCLSQKPIITQVEVNRNDFGECTDSCDLGTVWSWEDLMKTDAEPAKCIFTKDDLACHDCDAEFDTLDNSLDFVPDASRMPVPADMTIEDLVEELEENEDTVECKWCDELFDKSECCYEVDLGWLCDRCQQAIKSRGETLTFREGPLEESSKYVDSIEFHYDSLTVDIATKFIPATLEDPADYEEGEYTDEFYFEVDTDIVEEVLWDEFLSEEDVAEVPGGFATLEDESAWQAFLDVHFEELLAKYNDKFLEYFREDAEEAARDVFQERYNELQDEGPDPDLTYDRLRDSQFFGESAKPKSCLEELEEPETYRARLVDCPECGFKESFDHETGICINCGFNI